MKVENKINSEKITVSLRERLYHKFWEKNSKKSERIKLESDMVESFKDAFMNEYLKDQKEIEFFQKNKTLLGSVFINIDAELFDITFSEERFKSFNYKLMVEIPILFNAEKEMGDEDSKKKFIKNVLINQGIYEGFKRMYEKYTELVILCETCCDKYFPSTLRRSWRCSDDFCKNCTTTLQLKFAYPEIYQIYLEYSQLNERSVEIENLRRKLGFI